MAHLKRRQRAVIGTFLFAAAVPGTVVGLLPFLLAGRRLHRPFLGLRVTRMAGLALVAAGAPLVANAFSQFVRSAGTPAPVFETEQLVISGPYRYTRNPQYVGVMAMVVGQALIYGSWRVGLYAGCLGLSFHAFVVTYEEPRLRRRFGPDYDRYAADTPRWLGPIA